MNREELQELLADHQRGHTDFQMDHFITGSGWTDYGMYKQAIHELHNRYRALRDHYFEEKLLDIRIEDAEDKLARFEEENIRKREARVNLARLYAERGDMRARYDAILREFRRFYVQAKVLKQRIGELTIERRSQLDREYWLQEITMQAAIDIMTNPTGRLRQITTESIARLPFDMRIEVMDRIRKPQNCMLMIQAAQDRVPNLPPMNGELTEQEIRSAISCVDMDQIEDKTKCH